MAGRRQSGEVAVVVGAPTFAGDGPPRNSHLHVDEHGYLAAVVSKIGLTLSKAMSAEAPQGDAR
jgi:hypothetical protein